MNSDNIFIKVEGKGQGMVLLHGWGLNHQYMWPIYTYFKNAYKVCVLDLPGFGESVLPYSYTLDDYVQCIYDIVLFYHLDKPIFIAHSFGARIAFRYASKYPCSYIIATGAAGMKSKHGIDYYFKIYMHKMKKYCPFLISMGSEDYNNANPILRKTLVNIVNDHNENDIQQIKCPILLVYGEKDSETPIYMAKRMQRLNKDIALIVLEEEDHFAYYHQMERFIRICAYALKEGA